MTINDIHTHDPRRTGAIINWHEGMAFEPGKLYSAGVHPWDAADPGRLTSLPDSRQIVAVGEVGLDKLRGPSVEIQRAVLEEWLAIAGERHLPVILHIVKAFPEIIALKRSLRPDSPWIIHGFRGKPQLAEELLAHGFYLSLGQKYNPETLAVIPPDRLLAESDEAGSAPSLPGLDPTLADRIFLNNRVYPRV